MPALILGRSSAARRVQLNFGPRSESIAPSLSNRLCFTGPNFLLKVFLGMHAISSSDINMANKILGIKPARAPVLLETPPSSPLHERYQPPIKEDESPVSISRTRSSIKKRPYEVETGIPPSKNWKIPSLKTTRLFSKKSPTHLYTPQSSTSSSETPKYPLSQSNLPKTTYKHDRDQTATMPYNNTAIPPPEEITGAASLPCQSSVLR